MSYHGHLVNIILIFKTMPLKAYTKIFPPILKYIGDFFYLIDKKSRAKSFYLIHARHASKPVSSTIYQKIGSIQGAESKLIIAEYYLKKAVAINPNNSEALANLGQLCYINNDLVNSNIYLEKSRSLSPLNYKVNFHLAYLYFLTGNTIDALNYCKLSLSAKDWKPSLFLLLSIYEKQGSVESAISVLRKLIKIEPTDWILRLKVGQALNDINQLDEAIQALLLAEATSPNNPSILLEIGNAYKKALNPASAKDYYTKSTLSNFNDDTRSLVSKARACIELNDYEEALILLHRALEQDPESEEISYYIGHALIQTYQYDESYSYFDKIIAKDPDHYGSLANLGQAYYETGNPEKALYYLERAASIKPDNIENSWNLGLTLLATGNYDRGWKEYEWRWKLNNIIANPDRILTFENPPWDQKEKINNLIILPEQGLGDTIQFSRFIQPLQEFLGNSVTVSFFAGPKLDRITRYSDLVPSLSTAEAALKCENWLPLLSIPKMLSINELNSCPKYPYLFAESSTVEYWKNRYCSKGLIKVGIHWQGRPQTEVRGLQGRSLPLASFERLANKHDDLVFISLQKGYGVEQLNTVSFNNRFVSCQDEITESLDFLDTAAMVMACDLIITSDSALAHLSGALGKTTWLLLAKNSEWRWGVNSNTSHWYPSMRLFRQTELGNWPQVMASVSKAFEEWKEVAAFQKR